MDVDFSTFEQSSGPRFRKELLKKSKTIRINVQSLAHDLGRSCNKKVKRLARFKQFYLFLFITELD